MVISDLITIPTILPRLRSLNGATSSIVVACAFLEERTLGLTRSDLGGGLRERIGAAKLESGLLVLWCGESDGEEGSEKSELELHDGDSKGPDGRVCVF